MRKITIIICLIILITGIIYARSNHWFESPTAFAVGDLLVDWGVPEGNPIFTIINAAPGDSDTKTVSITNNASSTHQLGIKMDSIIASPSSYPEVLNIEIKEGAATLYSDTLKNFINDSSGANGFFIGTIANGATRSINIKISFDTDAGNDFQNANISFDLTIGIFIEIPAACQSMHFSGAAIFGTEGNDNIRGTNKSELIVLFEGNDNVRSGNGGDCIVGLSGNKTVSSGNNSDVVILGNGNSSVDTGNSADVVIAGNGNNSIRTGNGNDTVNVGNGSSNIKLGNGSDIFTALGGDNTVSGDNGNDNIDNGSSVLGTVNGGNGNDKCIARTITNCEL